MRELPAPPVLVNWFATFAGDQHGFTTLRSLCERIRWSAKLEADPKAPFCEECVHLARIAVNRVLDYVVDSQAAAGYAEQNLRNLMPERVLIAGYGGLPADD